jgi:hypothetical protein
MDITLETVIENMNVGFHRQRFSTDDTITAATNMAIKRLKYVSKFHFHYNTNQVSYSMTVTKQIQKLFSI